MGDKPDLVGLYAACHAYDGLTGDDEDDFGRMSAAITAYLASTRAPNHGQDVPGVREPYRSMTGGGITWVADEAAPPAADREADWLDDWLDKDNDCPRCWGCGEIDAVGTKCKVCGGTGDKDRTIMKTLIAERTAPPASYRAAVIDECAKVAEGFGARTEAERSSLRRNRGELWALHCQTVDIAAAIRALKGEDR